MRKYSRLSAVAVLLTIGTAAIGQTRTPRLIMLPVGAHSISGDGTHVGMAEDVWTEAGGAVRLPPMAGTTTRYADDFSYDGSIAAVTGYNINNGAFRAGRFAGGTLTVLNPLPGFDAAATGGISSDGLVITGQAMDPGRRAVRWTGSSVNPTALSVIPGTTMTSFGEGISGDGQVITGTLQHTQLGQVGYRWTAASGMQSLGEIPQQERGGGLAASFDGSVIVGWSRLLNSEDRATRWTEEEGLVDLGKLPGERNALARDVSADGKTVVGYSGTTTYYAMIWHEHRMSKLIDVLNILGVETTGWHFEDAQAISDDGLVVVGSGRFNGQFRGFVAVIPAPGAACVLVLGGSVGRRRRVGLRRDP